MNSIIRIAVFTMVVAGAISGLAMPKHVTPAVSHQATAPGILMPMCPLDDPNACGFR